jgi:hypothetical protein
MRGKAETVTRGLGGADAPARCRSARSHPCRRPEQDEGNPRASRREVQSSARLEIELLADRAGDGGGHGRTQRLLQGPKSLHLVLGLDQDQAGRIEAELVEAVPVGVAISGKTARRDDEEHRPLFRHASEERRGKTEGRRQIALGFGDDLVQRPARQPASRQMRIERGKVEGKGAFSGRGIFEPRQKPAQAVHDLGAASLGRERQGRSWLHDATSPSNPPKAAS